jgi:hypothetical protein
MTKINTGGDPNIQAGLGNLLNFFDPKNAAEGAALQARTRNFDAETRYNTARALGVEDQNSVLSDSALIAAGYTDPMERAAYRATRTNSVADWFGGRNKNQGFNMLTAPGATEDTIRAGALALGLDAAGRPNFAGTEKRANELNAAEASAKLAEIIAGRTVTANATTQRAKELADEKAKRDAAAGDKNERYAFTPEQVNGPVRQAIVDLYHAGVKDKDFKTLDEGLIRKIIDTQQTLIATGLSTRSASLNDALAALGYVNAENADERMTVTTETKPGDGAFADDVTEVSKVEAKKALDVDPSVLIPGDPALETRPGLIEIPLESARDMLPQIRDQAELGTMFKLGNRIYEKVQMQDGSFALKAVR